MAITDMFGGSSNDMDPMCGGFQLTRTQRLYGFAGCFVAGFIVSFLSTFLLITGNVKGYAVLYTFGNIISLLSTGFLIGFVSQFKRMFDPVRLTASIAFLVSMIITLAIAFGLPDGGLKTLLCFIMCFVQFLALGWYSLSYIPFGRDIIKKCCGSFAGSMV